MRFTFSFLMVWLCLHSLFSQPLEAELLGRWFNTDIPGSIYYNNAYNEVWGLAVNGQEYAIIGSTLGTHFINVTDPANPVEDFFVEGAVSADIVVHRDYHDFNGFLYAVSDEDYGTNQSTLQIIDISSLPEKIELVYDSNELIRKSHNIYIDSASAKLYALAAAGGDWPYSPAKSYDISDPTNPVLIKRYSEFENIGVGHVHDAFILRDTAYLNCGGDGLLIVDFSNPQNEKVLSNLSTMDYPESGYNHSGWATEDGNYYYMADETWGKSIKVLDVKNKSAIETKGTFNAGSSSQYSIPHNLIVHCGFLFVSYYYDGLQVYDISDPEQPIRIMYYPTSQIPHNNTYEGAWGVYPFLPSGNILVSDMQEGLFVVKGPEGLCQINSKTTQLELKGNITAYPNPNNGQLFFENHASDSQGIYSFTIFNAVGQELGKGEMELNGSVNMDISQYFDQNGMLMIKLSRGLETQWFKIIIQ